MKAKIRKTVYEKLGWLVCKLIGKAPASEPTGNESTAQEQQLMQAPLGEMPLEVTEASRKLDETKRVLLVRANSAYAKIRPCGGRRDWEDCYTIENEHLVLWFDDCSSKSTHVVTSPLNRIELDTRSLVTAGLIDENGRFTKNFAQLIIEETHGKRAEDRRTQKNQ